MRRGVLPVAEIFPPAVQRPRLLELQQALDARASCLRRDECGDWAIFGTARHGKWYVGDAGERCIYAVPEGFQLVYISRYGVNEWDGAGPHMQDYAAAKGRLVFCRLAQDGTGEGIFFLDRLPTEAEAEAIREVMGIPRKKQLSEETLLALRERGKSLQEARKTKVEGTAAVELGRAGAMEPVP